METKKPDRRVHKTEKSLRDALIELMIEKGYTSVTVQHILDRAGVGRSTFYAHFPDKEALLKSSIANLAAGLTKHWKDVLASEAKPRGELAFVLPFLKHIDSHRHVYKATAEIRSMINREFYLMLAQMVRTDLKGRRGIKGGEPRLEIAVHSITGSLMALMEWWMEHPGVISPQELNSMFLRLCLPGLNEGLSGDR